MEIGFMILADSGEAINGKVYLLGGGWNVLNLPALPQEWTFAIALGLDISWDETNQTHQLSLQVQGPDGDQLGEEFTLQLETGRPAGALVGQDQRLSLSFTALATFNQSGPHAVVVKRADEEIGRTRFYVFERPPQSSSPAGGALGTN
jgi:hypothetical protein